MSKEKFCELVDQLCEKFDVEDRESRYDDCHLEIDEIAFTLVHRDEVDDEGFFIYAEFGQPPAKIKALAMRRLLETNLFSYGHNKPGFGCNPETGCVLMMLRIPVLPVPLAGLTDLLANIAAQAQLWRQTYFFMGPELEQMAA